MRRLFQVILRYAADSPMLVRRINTNSQNASLMPLQMACYEDKRMFLFSDRIAFRATINCSLQICGHLGSPN